MSNDQLISPVIGIIGGFGLYEMKGLENPEWRVCETPWGTPSDELLFGTIQGMKCVFLPRHGRGEPLPPSRLNYRANIDILKRAGVTDIIAFSSVTSLKEDIHPGECVCVNQFIDQTQGRARTFFEEGCVAQVSMAQPVSLRLVNQLLDVGNKHNFPIHQGGTYIVIEGPQFDTIAESDLYRSWGGDVVGMSAMPEAALAREAEMNYAVIGLVGSYDSWYEKTHKHVTVEELLKNRAYLNQKACDFLSKAIPDLGKPRPICVDGADRALDNAILTPVEQRCPSMIARLDAVAGRVLLKEDDDWGV